MNILPLIILGVLINAGAQLLLKAGMLRIGTFDFSLSNIIPIGIQVMMNPYVLLGLTAYVISVIVWLMVLSRAEVSYAYPMLSIGYIVNAIIAYYWFDENVSLLRMSGIILTIIGVYLITLSRV